MKTIAKASWPLMLGALVVAMLPAAALAEEWVFVAGIDGGQEVPPNGVPQSGHATLFLNESQTQVSYFIEYDDLPGETAAHFHLAPLGVNGPVVHPLPVGSPKFGVWAIAPEHVQALFDGEIYVNMHTPDFPGGAIRGQFEFCVVPVEQQTWGAVKSLFE